MNYFPKYIRIRRMSLIAVAFLSLNFTAIKAQANPAQPQEKIDLQYGRILPSPIREAAIQRFENYGLGQFIHWGIYAIPGNEWNGVSARKGAAASEWIRSWSGPTAPKDWKHIYDNLYKQFNPKDFDAKRWAKQAKEMGARYVIFTTKHHDGFAMWPTEFSKYNISQTPYKKDIVKQIVDAYTAEGIDVFLYYSILDWTDPNWMYSAPKTPEEQARWNKFLGTVKGQLFELVGHYPQIKGLWFDGTWDKSWVSSYQFAYNLEKELRAKHPGLIIGSRFRADETGHRGTDANGNLIGDYEQGWERKLPKTFADTHGNPWEGIMTIPPNGWGYMKDWSGLYTKTSYDLIQMMMKARSMGGNFVINFGPDGKGDFKTEEDKIMSEVGAWMKVNSPAVYDTRHADIPTVDYGYFTQKGNDLYLTVFNRPINNILRIAINKKAVEVPGSAALLLNHQNLEIKRSDIGLDRDPNTYYDIVLPEDFKPKMPFVVQIQLQTGTTKTDQLMDAKK